MEVTLTPLHKNIQHLTNEEQLMVKVVVPKEFKDVQTLPPKHLCFILDTSGSMTDVFGTLIKSVKSGINKLREEDTVCVICYNSTVTLMCEWNKCTDAFKKKLDEKLSGLKCGGSTNISGALLKSIEQSMKVPEETVTTVFLTDGLANEGVTDINNLGVMLKKILPGNTTVHSLGFNEKHNPIFLKKVAEVCNNGTYVFIENEDVLKGSFIDIIGKTMEVAYQNVKLTLVSDDVNFSDRQTEKDFVTLPLGDLHIGETRKWIVNTKFTKENSNYEIRAKVEGMNVIEVKPEVNFEDITLTRGDNNTVDEEVEKRIHIIEASKAVKIASELANKRNFLGAEKILRHTSANLRGLPTIQHGLNELARGCSDNTFLNTSSHRMTSYQQSLEVESDSLYNGPPSTGLGIISPIKTPKKTVMVNTFFPPSDDEEDDIKVQKPPLTRSIAQQNLPSIPANLFRDPQFEEGSTNESTEEDQLHSLA